MRLSWPRNKGVLLLRAGFAGSLVAISAFTALVISAGIRSGNQPLPSGKRTGFPQLVSYQRLPEMDGEMCEWIPASAQNTLIASLQQQRGIPESRSAGDVWSAATATRPPLRMIRDPYAAYSAVAVDSVRNEVVLTDENLFTILAYDRMENTPPTATMSEPKRVIGGLKTRIEFQCGLYIDQGSGDIYAVNNDTVDSLVIFSRQAKGDVPPSREIKTPHGTFGIAVDEQAQELFLTVQHDSAVVVYRKTAAGEEAPIRLLQGDRTRLADPHGIAIDPKNGLMYITNHGSVHSVSASKGPGEGTLGRGKDKPNWPIGLDDAVPGSGRLEPPSIAVFPLKANGDTAPLRVIEGPRTQMNWPTGIALDPEREELSIANDSGDSILVFDTKASGDTAPIRVLKGSKTLIKNPTGVHIDLKNDEVWVANFGNHSATVYKRGAAGDAPPLRIIRSAMPDKPTPGIGNPGALAYDTKREEILVPN
jgi:DNA-binding beta-propeller fold protein YncE